MKILLSIIMFLSLSITSFSYSGFTAPGSNGGYNNNISESELYHNKEIARQSAKEIKKARAKKRAKKKAARKAKRKAARKAIPTTIRRIKATKKPAKKSVTTTTRIRKISGVVHSITDGDTFKLNWHKIRICGIAAPERGAEGGSEATAYLSSILKGKRAVCHPVGGGTPCDGRSKRTSHGRIVAQCFVGGRDLACMMVRAGHAKDYRRHSGGYYAGCR